MVSYWADHVCNSYYLSSLSSTTITLTTSKLTSSFLTLKRHLTVSHILCSSTSFIAWASLETSCPGYNYCIQDKRFPEMPMQVVIVDGSLSSVLPVTSRMPKGGILGPLLFAIFINDLPSRASSSAVLMFADDTKCIHTIDAHLGRLLLQVDLQALFDWSEHWRLPFNCAKCKSMHITPPLNTDSISTSYLLNNLPICPVTSHRDLGVLLSSDISWSVHYSSIISKALKKFYFLRHSMSLFHLFRTKLFVYCSLIRPTLLYCSQVWCPHLVKDVKYFENVQHFL